VSGSNTKTDGGVPELEIMEQNKKRWVVCLALD